MFPFNGSFEDRLSFTLIAELVNKSGVQTLSNKFKRINV